MLSYLSSCVSIALLSLSVCFFSSNSSLSWAFHSHREKENRESLYSGLLLDSMTFHRGAITHPQSPSAPNTLHQDERPCLLCLHCFYWTLLQFVLLCWVSRGNREWFTGIDAEIPKMCVTEGTLDRQGITQQQEGWQNARVIRWKAQKILIRFGLPREGCGPFTNRSCECTQSVYRW